MTGLRQVAACSQHTGDGQTDVHSQCALAVLHLEASFSVGFIPLSLSLSILSTDTVSAGKLGHCILNFSTPSAPGK